MVVLNTRYPDPTGKPQPVQHDVTLTGMLRRMAPVAPLGKNGALALLRAGKLPFSFGSPHPFVAVVEQDGVFRVRELVVDPIEAGAAAKAAMAEGRGWMPEQHYALGKPTGRVFIEAPTREALAEKLEAYPWPRDW